MDTGYTQEVIKKFQQATKRSADRVMEVLSNTLDDQEISHVVDRVLYSTYAGWDQAFVARMKPVVAKWTNKLYREYRQDTAVFGTLHHIPKPTFGMPDTRALQFFLKNDEFYLGQFITDPDTKVRITNFVRENYLRNGEGIGRNPEALADFKSKFENVLNGEDWKIRRVIDTTVSRMRTTGACNYMDQAGILEFEVVGVMDRLTCPYCENLHGRRFSVPYFKEKLSQRLFDPNTLPDELPFATSKFPDLAAMKELEDEEIQRRGIGIPPFHPHCRDTIIAVNTESSNEDNVIVDNADVTDTSKMTMPEHLAEKGYS